MLGLVQRAVGLNRSYTGSVYLESQICRFVAREIVVQNECDALQSSGSLIANRPAVLWFGVVVL